MNYRIVAEGFVSQRPPHTPTSITAGSRCVRLDGGELVCSFVGQAASGRNDFKPMLARSGDLGATWSEPQLIWPHLQERFSIFGSISRSSGGELYFYGMRTPIAHPGENAWNEATHGLKQNELIWSHSPDEGLSWAEPAVIPMPIPGSAEAPGPLCATRDGSLVGCYSPYNTFDPQLRVETNQVICLASPDRGRTWTSARMIHLPQPEANAAEAWIVQLADGRLLGTCWHICGEQSLSNAYALSFDGGRTWSPTRPTGTLGQSTGLAALPDGRAAFVYNQRKHGTIGVWLAIANPTEQNFGLLANAPVWTAEIAVRNQGGGDFANWTSFAFGEPSATPLPDGTIFVTFWVAQPSGHGIRYVRVRCE